MKITANSQVPANTMTVEFEKTPQTERPTNQSQEATSNQHALVIEGSQTPQTKEASQKPRSRRERRRARRRRRRRRRKARRRRRRKRMKKFFKKVGNAFKKLGKALGKALSWIGKIGVYVGMIANFVLPGIGTLISAAASVAAQVGQALQHGIKNVKEFLKMLGNVALDTVGSIPGVGQAVQVAVKAAKAVRSAVRAVKSVIANGAKSIGAAISSVVGSAVQAAGGAIPESVARNIGRGVRGLRSAFSIGNSVKEGTVAETLVEEAAGWASLEASGADSAGGRVAAYGVRAVDSVADIVQGGREGELADAMLGEAQSWMHSEVGAFDVLSDDAQHQLRGFSERGFRAVNSVRTVAESAQSGDVASELLEQANSWVDAELGRHGLLSEEGQERLQNASQTVHDIGQRVAHQSSLKTR